LILFHFPSIVSNWLIIPAAFSSSKKNTIPEARDSTGGWNFSIKDITLNTIYFTYHDELIGTNADINLGTFETTVDVFDLQKKRIHVKSIQLKNTRATVIQNVSYQIKENQPSKPFDFDKVLGNLELTN